MFKWIIPLFLPGTLVFFVLKQIYSYISVHISYHEFWHLCKFPADLERISMPRFLIKCFAKTLIKNKSKLFLLSIILYQEISMTSSFYPSTFVYNRFSPKIQFLYCVLSSVASLGGPMVDTQGRLLEFRSVDCSKMHFSWIFLGILEFYWEF